MQSAHTAILVSAREAQRLLDRFKPEFAEDTLLALRKILKSKSAVAARGQFGSDHAIFEPRRPPPPPPRRRCLRRSRSEDSTVEDWSIPEFLAEQPANWRP